ILHRMVKDTLEYVSVFEDMVGLAETLLDITPAKVESAHQIARTLVVNHRRVWLQCLAGVEDDWQVFIFHLDALQGLLGEHWGLCSHSSHGLPFISHFLQGDQRRRSLTLCTVGYRVQERLEMPQALTRHHRMHAWQPLGPLRING